MTLWVAASATTLLSDTIPLLLLLKATVKTEVIMTAESSMATTTSTRV
jgi:hypothetical protein